AKRLARCGLSIREMQRKERKRKRRHVGRKVSGIGQEGQAARRDAPHRLDREQAGCDREGAPESTAIATALLARVVVTRSAAPVVVTPAAHVNQLRRSASPSRMRVRIASFTTSTFCSTAASSSLASPSKRSGVPKRILNFTGNGTKPPRPSHGKVRVIGNAGESIK